MISERSDGFMFSTTGTRNKGSRSSGAAASNNGGEVLDLGSNTATGGLVLITSECIRKMGYTFHLNGCRLLLPQESSLEREAHR